MLLYEASYNIGHIFSQSFILYINIYEIYSHMKPREYIASTAKMPGLITFDGPHEPLLSIALNKRWMRQVINNN